MNFQLKRGIILIWTIIMSSFAQSQSYCDSNPVDIHGNLSVSGNRIVDQNNSAVSFAGNSMFWSNTGWGGEDYYTQNTISWLKDDWGTTIVRAAMGVEDSGGYLSDTSNKDKVETVVDAAISEGLYVIIDWHSHYAEDYESQAIAFFKEMAQKYGDYPNVIYEIYNEPIYSSWSGAVKPYAEAVISEIRAIDSDNLIIVGSPTWSQDVDVASNDPITSSSNIAYTLHFYAGTHTESLRTKAQTALDNGIALMVTEWGTVDASGDGSVNSSSTDEWMEFLADNDISHLNWSVNDKSEGASILQSEASSNGNWSDSDLTESGLKVKSIIENWMNYCDGDPISNTYVSVPSKIEAEDYSDATEGRTQTVNSITNVGWIDNGESLSYNIDIPSSGEYTIDFRVASLSNGAQFNIFLGNSYLGNVSNSATGDWQSWETVSTTVNFSSSGDQTLNIIATGSGWNIDWLEVKSSSSNNNLVHITKRNATGWALDGGGTEKDGENVYLWNADSSNENQLWEEIDRGNGYYSYQKYGTNYSLDGGKDGANNQTVYLWTTSASNVNQQWEKQAIGDGGYKLVKRDVAYAINSGNNGERYQDVNLYDSNNSSQNLQWYISYVGSAKSLAPSNTEEGLVDLNLEKSSVAIYPNPVESITTIQGAANSTIKIYDIKGSMVLTKNIVGESETIDLSKLIAGVYYVHINELGSTSTIKIIKQ